MNNTLKSAFIFVAGATVGSLVTWKFLESKCEARISEEVTSFKEAFRNRYSKDVSDDTEEQIEKSEEIPNIAAYDAVLKKESYVDYSGIEDKVLHTARIDAPYVITPDEFGEFDDYEHITLFYYTDGIVATREDDIIDDVDDIIGVDSLTHFGEYEDDAVHVRNDARRCDYEILRSEESYAETIKSKPHPNTEVK